LLKNEHSVSWLLYSVFYGLASLTRKKSEFITESLKERIRKMEQEKLQSELAEGYKVRKAESLSLAEDFEQADLDGWDEY
jgi:hypothetical protein